MIIGVKSDNRSNLREQLKDDGRSNWATIRVT